MPDSSPEASPGHRDAAAGSLQESDLALIEALQHSPRAPWSQIGPALGVDATSVARRWHRLVGQGLAWLTAYPSASTTSFAYVDVRCRPNTVDEVTRHLCALPQVLSVEEVTGDFDLLLTVAAPTPAALAALVRRDLPTAPGVEATAIHLGLRLYQEGSGWRMRALDRQQRSLLVPPQRPTRRSLTGATADAALIAALGRDGRRSHQELARDLGVSEATVRRRLQRLMEARSVHFRCDFAQGAAGWPLTATYRIDLPADRLTAAARALSLMPEVRLCSAVSGTAGFLVIAWLRTTEDVTGFEAHMCEQLPDLRVLDRTVTLITAKRMGRLLDPHGRAVGHVPWDDLSTTL
ncbi:Lrp/AsnC family transcriptional regulator [Streptomyces sp. NPDC056723]|uniref:Lrp/AsnC family transcriptional regulator n=1 Tax=Streptomyces sp. NPDC056723 TaxID=3345925 RepID=UPI0036A43B3A